jgi:metal-sulfur cluster biosynthetic enzyme
MVSKEEIIEALKKVEDPELGIDVYTLELIYNINIEKGIVNILMTFTSPACPFGGMLIEAIDSEVKKIKGVKDIKIDITFDPMWQPSEELRAAFGI